MNDWHVIGIDPAPSKPATACVGAGEFREIDPSELRRWIEEQIERHPRLLITWDSPLSFDPSFGYSYRPVKKALRGLLDEVLGQEDARLAKGAVSVRPFSGCSHRPASCDALGLPFGVRPGGLQLVDGPARLTSSPAPPRRRGPPGRRAGHLVAGGRHRPADAPVQDGEVRKDQRGGRPRPARRSRRLSRASDCPRPRSRATTGWTPGWPGGSVVTFSLAWPRR